MFHFKQFSVDQTGCAMKINTDGVLLGALTAADDPLTILDIGTGTGVIALMLAQRFVHAKIDAVEIDAAAARTAQKNFSASKFANRMTLYPQSFETYFDQNVDRKYDLVVANPPFYIHSLLSPLKEKEIAKHAGEGFFETLIAGVASHLSGNGLFWVILPLAAAALTKKEAMQQQLHVNRVITVRSFTSDEPHREILCLGRKALAPELHDFAIYEAVGVYAEAYKKLLQPYFINF
jgi:tRNA1Val (adenine37-N6)-methyltransferase